MNNITNTGLVLEGGGLRGVYTSGVLQYFMERNLFLPYVIGVSMGACNGANYVSCQPNRNKIVNINYVNDPRYISYFKLITKGELFGMRFIFDTIPHMLVPFDYKTFFESKIRYITVVTDCLSGNALYYEKNELGTDFLSVLSASTSLPFISKPVKYKDHILMDGGISDSIPVRKSIADGNKKNVIILTQPKGYRKKTEFFVKFAPIFYPQYAGLKKTLKNRHVVYNSTIDYIDALERDGDAFVIRPKSTLAAGRVERNKQILYSVYTQGYKDAVELYGSLIDFLAS